uniref:SWIM-type domain-containing protein n=1 Tax=Tanacetum cinerariifolium TaxID=118510 RepID=A0A6L2L809_TANCI|nr:hypothetical protein [Tanacetum cinerariifolium]
MRPLLITDRAHLKGTYKGTNLVLVGIDGNNQIIPIATCVSQDSSVHTLSDWATHKVMDRIKKNANWKVYGIHQGKVYQVDDRQKVHRVDLTTRSCTCRKWQLSGIPCGHVIAVGRVMGCNDCSDMALAYTNMIGRSQEYDPAYTNIHERSQQYEAAYNNNHGWSQEYDPSYTNMIRRSQEYDLAYTNNHRRSQEYEPTYTNFSGRSQDPHPTMSFG